MSALGLLGSLVVALGAALAVILRLVSRGASLKRERDDALEHVDTRNRVEEASRDAPTDPDRARDALRMRRDKRP